MASPSRGLALQRNMAVTKALLTSGVFFTISCSTCSSSPPLASHVSHASTTQRNEQRVRSHRQSSTAFAARHADAISAVFSNSAGPGSKLLVAMSGLRQKHRASCVVTAPTRLHVGQTRILARLSGGGGGGVGGEGRGGEDSFGLKGRQGLPSIDTPRQYKTPSQSGDVYKAKQSLGQNFLVDQGMARKMVSQVEDTSPQGRSVVEVGPGKGALSALLLSEYPNMTAIEIDQRSVAYLRVELPKLDIRHQDVLTLNWGELASEKAEGDQLSVIGNLPYYIVSQILFSILDAAPHVKKAVLTMQLTNEVEQLEVAQRVVAAPKCKAYGILSVTSQLYSTPRLAFKIPPTVFQPQPDVDSALVVFDFPRQRPHFGINECHLRTVLRSSFQMRRKMLRQSLKELCKTQNVILPDSWGTLRPEALSPQQFVELTKLIFGEGATPAGVSVWRGKLDDEARLGDKDSYDD